MSTLSAPPARSQTCCSAASWTATPACGSFLCHASGTVPYLAKRLTYASTVNPKLTPRVLQNLLGSLRRLYYETAMSANPST